MKDTLYVSDLDGTLLLPDATLGGETVERLSALMAQGLQFTYATARSFKRSWAIAQQLPLALPVVCYNGCTVVNPQTGEVLRRCTFEPEEFNQVVRMVKEHSLLPLIYAILDGRERVSWMPCAANSAVHAYAKEREGDERMRPVQSYGELFAGDVFYMTLIGETAPMQAVAQSLRLLPGLVVNAMPDTYYPQDFWVEVYRRDAGKDNAVHWLREYLGAKRTVCFGDNLNDLSMFRYCDEGYAVQNACEELRAAASAVIGPNHAHGVARWLCERYPEAWNP